MQSNGAQCICRCAASVVRWPDTGGPLLLLLLLLLLLYFYCSFFFLLRCYYYSFCYSFAIILAAIAMLLQLCPAGCSSCANIIFPYSQVYKEGGHLCFVLGCFIDLLCKALCMLVYHAVPCAFHCFSWSCHSELPLKSPHYNCHLSLFPSTAYTTRASIRCCTVRLILNIS